MRVVGLEGFLGNYCCETKFFIGSNTNVTALLRWMTALSEYLIWIDAKYNLMYLTIFWKLQNPSRSVDELVEQWDRSIKFSTQIVLLVTSIFLYSATPDLSFDDLYNRFCVENSAFLFTSAWRIFWNC